jgi:hypothetical protein
MSNKQLVTVPEVFYRMAEVCEVFHRSIYSPLFLYIRDCAFFHRVAVFFSPQRAQRLRRGRKGFASFAKPLRPLQKTRSLCALCEAFAPSAVKKHRYAVKTPSIYFVTIPKLFLTHP